MDKKILVIWLRYVKNHLVIMIISIDAYQPGIQKLDRIQRGFVMINLHSQISLLKNSRSLFHSEADFQFALAWEIQKSYSKANIRLEYCPAKFPNMHLDILVELEGKWFPIELKYKTLKMNTEIGILSY